MNRKEKLSVVQRSLELGLLTFALLSAFSKATRYEIGKRDHWSCQDCGRQFKKGYMLHAAHYDHDRENPDYDQSYMGRMLCVECHKNDHIDTHGANGLSKRGNQTAIRILSGTNLRTRKWRASHGQTRSLTTN